MIVDAIWPRVGCGAAICKSGQLLLVRRRRQPEMGCWGLPGGKVDPFETVANATAREIFEEINIVIKATELLCVVDHIDQAEDQHWVAPVFLVESFEGTPTIMEPDALSDLAWFDMDALPATLTAATEQAVAVMDLKVAQARHSVGAR